MDSVEADLLARHQVPRHRLTVQDYHCLAEAGVPRVLVHRGPAEGVYGSIRR